jgi:hypothetical protein
VFGSAPNALGTMVLGAQLKTGDKLGENFASPRRLCGETISVFRGAPKSCLSCLSRRSFSEGGSEVEGAKAGLLALSLLGVSLSNRRRVSSVRDLFLLATP